MSNYDESEDETDVALTVRQVIELLSTLPPDAKVLSDGCDCVGSCVDVYYCVHNKAVIMSRSRRGVNVS